MQKCILIQKIPILTYKWATAFECLFGYLYLKEDKTRIDELMKIIIGEEIC